MAAEACDVGDRRAENQQRPKLTVSRPSVISRSYRKASVSTKSYEMRTFVVHKVDRSKVDRAYLENKDKQPNGLT